MATLIKISGKLNLIEYQHKTFFVYLLGIGGLLNKKRALTCKNSEAVPFNEEPFLLYEEIF